MEAGDQSALVAQLVQRVAPVLQVQEQILVTVWIRRCVGAERRCSGVIVEVMLGALERFQLRTVEQIVDPLSAFGTSGTHLQRTVQLVLVPLPAEQNLDVAAGTVGRAQLPIFGHCARSDVAGLDGLHQLVWAVEAGGRSEVRPRGGVFRGRVHRGHGPN